MKELWLEIAPTIASKEKEILLKLASGSCDYTVEGAKATSQKDESTVTILDSFNRDEITRLKLDGKLVSLRINISGKEDENTASEAAQLLTDYLIISCSNWHVIPLENVIAKTRGKSRLIAKASNAEEAKLVLETLELGTDGVLLITSDPSELARTVAVVKKQNPKIQLTAAIITAVKQISTGARVCVDTCELMTTGEGILVGCQSAGFMLVEAEVHENPYVQARPFRVNAGSLSMYTLGSQQQTRYLSELKTGDEVLIVDRKGNVRVTNVGRAKIEMRPLLLIEAEAQGKTIRGILQNAETIRLVTPEGSKPVTELEKDDEIIAHIAATGGRHFGIAVPDETVIER